MCGRYATTTSRATLLETFMVDDGNADPELAPDYNVAPTKTSAVVVERLGKEADRAQEAVRQVRALRFGLVPFFSKTSTPKVKMINARAETVDQKPSYRTCFTKRRGILAVSGFYEWFPSESLGIGKSGKPLKQPYYIHPTASEILPIAVIYDFWRKPDAAEGEDPFIASFSIITTIANDDLGKIHDRMPMTVDPDDWADWLDPRNTDTDYARKLMAAPEPGQLATYPVATLVNNVRSNSPKLIEPVDVDG